MAVPESLASMFQAFMAQFNLAPTGNSATAGKSATPSNSVPSNNSVPAGNSHLPSRAKASVETLLLYYRDCGTLWPPHIPPSWPPVSSPSSRWRVIFTFGQEMDKLLSDAPLTQLTGWTAHVDILARDVPAMMRDGFLLGQDNIQEHEGYLRRTQVAGLGTMYNRFYAIAGPTWSGNLNVCAWTVEPVVKFRIHELSADKVIVARVRNWASQLVYSYDARTPEENGNYMYDGMSLEGLWPWPRKEEGPKDRGGKHEAEVDDQGSNAEQGGKKEDEGMRCFSPWVSEENLLIDLPVGTDGCQ